MLATEAVAKRESAAAGGRPDATYPPWAWPAAALLISAALLLPFLVVDVPAVVDYPNHLARFYILAHSGDPVLLRPS